MKHLFKLMTLAALGTLLAAGCNQNKKDEPLPEKPTVTADMYTVTANAETGEVVFKFTAEGLSPFWTVTEPSGQKTTFTDREVTKTYTAEGVYNGTLIAYGTGGQSDPAPFSFMIGDYDASLSNTENVLVSCTWRPYHLGWYGGEGEGYWIWEEGVPDYLADDRVIFQKDGKIQWNQGETRQVYNDAAAGGAEDYTFTGNEKWAYVKEGDKEYMQFSNGGFPGIKGNDASVNAKFEITHVTATSVTLLICVGGEDPNYHMYLTLVPEDWVEPEPAIITDVTEEQALAAISGKKFTLSDLGWWGGTPGSEGYWDYFTVPNEEVLPPYMCGDYITFAANGSLTYALKLDDPIEDGGAAGHFIYNDGAGALDYTATGNEKWSVVTEASVTKVSFSNGGFPLVIAGQKGEPTDPNYWFGRDGKWILSSIDVDGTVRMEIYQDFNEQWVTVFLTPVTE